MEEFGSEVYHPRDGAHFCVLVDRVLGLCIFYLTADARRLTQTEKPGCLEAGKPGGWEVKGKEARSSDLRFTGYRGHPIFPLSSENHKILYLF